MTVLWPWDPDDEDITLIRKLHPRHKVPKIVPYTGELIDVDEMVLVKLILDNPQAVVYTVNSAIPVLIAALAGCRFRIIELDEDGYLPQYIYEYVAKPRGRNESRIQLRRIWPESITLETQKRTSQAH